MGLTSWLRYLTSSRVPRSRRQHRPAVPRFRPSLEALEDRMLLSDYPAFSVSELIAAISAANNAGGANTITLAADTTFTLSAVNNTTNGANGLPVIGGTATNGPKGNKPAPAPSGNALTILGNGAMIERSTAAGTAAFRLFDVAPGASLTLVDVTLQNGWALGSGGAAYGGAIYNEGTLTLSGGTVRNNTAQGSDGAAGLVTDKKQNAGKINGQAGADARGGGIWSSGVVTLQGNTTLWANQASGGRGGDAGYYWQSPYNVYTGGGGSGGAGLGGGLYQAGGSVTLSSASVTGNTAQGGAGGLNMTNQTRSINGTRIIDAAGGLGAGGGLYVAAGTLQLQSTTVADNQARGGTGGAGLGGPDALPGPGGAGAGGGIYVAGGTVTLAFVAVRSNQAVGGEGGWSGDDSGDSSWHPNGSGGAGLGGGLYAGGGSVTLTNTTVTGNEAFGAGPASAGGGLYLLPTAAVCLDTATRDAVFANYAFPSELEDNISGPYSLC